MYQGPGNGKTGPRVAANTFVSNGVLVLRTTQINGTWYSAGVGTWNSLAQTYGMWNIRARFDSGAGVRCAVLLWPAGNSWPPEVDFMEIPSMAPLRHWNTLTNHYGSTDLMQHASYGGDFTQWHTIGVQWTPSSIKYTMDGVVKRTMTGHVPAQNMWLGITTELGTGAYAPSSATPAKVDLDVDWVQIYKFTG